MRYAVLGDIHSNLTALRAVLEDVRRHACDRLLSVGDVVGYGANPEGVIDLLREAGALVVQGNHDEAICAEETPAFFNPAARAAADWTRSTLDSEQMEWLRNLPLTRDLEGCSLAHGTYDEPQEFRYLMSVADAEPSLDQAPQPICFVGHTHVPVIVLRSKAAPERSFYTTSNHLDLNDCHAALINPGSVGQPRDEDPRAAWGLLDTEEGHYSLHRVEYEIAEEARRIRGAGLPPFLADRLFLGV